MQKLRNFLPKLIAFISVATVVLDVLQYAANKFKSIMPETKDETKAATNETNP